MPSSCSARVPSVTGSSTPSSGLTWTPTSPRTCGLSSLRPRLWSLATLRHSTASAWLAARWLAWSLHTRRRCGL
uniref:Uncharacterized protein n=1 Tax=uncultured marine virus TaxID=186617 RepID=A0A0F7L9A4_9VIRU|nr:hypothetical protein [uncultured marine virus]